MERHLGADSLAEITEIVGGTCHPGALAHLSRPCLGDVVGRGETAGPPLDTEEPPTRDRRRKRGSTCAVSVGALWKQSASRAFLRAADMLFAPVRDSPLLVALGPLA